jgi:hypothetical protein
LLIQGSEDFSGRGKVSSAIPQKHFPPADHWIDGKCKGALAATIKNSTMLFSRRFYQGLKNSTRGLFIVGSQPPRVDYATRIAGKRSMNNRK